MKYQDVVQECYWDEYEELKGISKSESILTR